MDMRSHAEFTFDSPRHYFGTVTSDSRTGGRPHHTMMRIDGRFLSPDCGRVRPLRP
jgi:hypothetical protein